MRRPCEAIDATVLAPAIRINGTVEGNVRRVITRDDPPRRIDRHSRLERRQIVETLPAVVEGIARERLVTPGGIRVGPPAAPALTINIRPRLKRRRGQACCQAAKR